MNFLEAQFRKFEQMCKKEDFLFKKVFFQNSFTMLSFIYIYTMSQDVQKKCSKLFPGEMHFWRAQFKKYSKKDFGLKMCLLKYLHRSHYLFHYKQGPKLYMYIEKKSQNIPSWN